MKAASPVSRPEEGSEAYDDFIRELQRRGGDILTAMGRTFAELKGKMRVMPMAGLNAELVRINPQRLLEATMLAGKVEDIVKEFWPGLLILDTSADVFGGDEINRVQVRFFVSMLRRMAMEHDLAVLLLSHPSVVGMQTGTGLSGSTAWNNSVRSRLYLTFEKDDDDPPVTAEINGFTSEGVFPIIETGTKTTAGCQMRFLNSSIVATADPSLVISSRVAGSEDKATAEMAG